MISAVLMQASIGEESNMLLVPSWKDHIKGDQVLRQLVDDLLAAVGPLALQRRADVRPALAPIAAALAASAVDTVEPPGIGSKQGLLVILRIMSLMKKVVRHIWEGKLPFRFPLR